MTKRFPVFLLALIISLPAFAQGTSSPAGGSSSAGGDAGRAFQAAVNLGSDLLPNPSTGITESWTKLGFQPDLALGKLGVGLDLTFRFKLYPNASTPVEIYEPDWIPQAGQTILDVYLPKIMYVRYGLRGQDPFYAKLGSINDLTLGNGFIVGDYSNARFMPKLRLFGLQVGLDGSAFKVPYFGFEALTGNLSQLDVVGARVYLKPLGGSKSFIARNFQIGGTIVTDQKPLLYYGATTINGHAAEAIYEIGADITAPLVASPVFSMTAFVEGAREQSEAMGAAAGVTGKLLGLVRYGAQGRYFQSGFVPTYFDANYDLYRASRFDTLKSTVPGAWVPGWLASLGLSVMNEKIQIGASLDGPVPFQPSSPTNNQADYPHLKGRVLVGEGIVGGLSLEGVYEKYYLGKRAAFFADLTDFTDASIRMNVHYKTGATVLTLTYDYIWVPSSTGGAFDVRSSLSASVGL